MNERAGEGGGGLEVERQTDRWTDRWRKGKKKKETNNIYRER